MEPLRHYLNQFQLTIIGQNADEARAESRVLSLKEEMDVNRLEINANTEYSGIINSLDSDDESSTVSTGLNLSISMPLSLEQSLTRQKQKLSLIKAKSELALLRLRQQSEVMLQILKIHKLYNLVNNSKRKLPIIEEQIEYYKLRQKIGKSNVKELSQAELSKLKAQNEVINLESRIGVELSKLESNTPITVSQIIIIPEVPISFPDDKLKCNFYDPEKALKTLEVGIKALEIKLAKSRRIPVASLTFGLGSTDHHSGPHRNAMSAGVSITAPLYSGGAISTAITQAERQHELSTIDLKVHKKEFEKRQTNFIELERSLVRSVKQAEEQIRKNEVEIKELVERGDAGFSVFADLSERKLQQIELLGISLDLENRLTSFWVDYLENFVESN